MKDNYCVCCGRILEDNLPLDEIRICDRLECQIEHLEYLKMEDILYISPEWNSEFDYFELN